MFAYRCMFYVRFKWWAHICALTCSYSCGNSQTRETLVITSIFSASVHVGAEGGENK